MTNVLHWYEYESLRHNDSDYENNISEEIFFASREKLRIIWR